MSERETSKYFKASALFAACNSAAGFHSFFREIFYGEEVRRIYLITGGPGTGKGTFMRRFGQMAEQKGREVAYYYCSSDPDSLDAVVVDDHTVLLDATSPHTVTPQLPGAREECVNLGAFWDADRLAEQREEIAVLCRDKEACYRRAYRYLSGCGSLAQVNGELLVPLVERDKMRRALNRLLKDVPCGDAFHDTPCLCHAVSMKGEVRREDYKSCAKQLYTVSDWYGTARFFLEAVAQEAVVRGIPIRTLRNPILPQILEGVCFCHCGTAFVSVEPREESDGTCINMKRFLRQREIPAIRGEYRRNMQLHEALLGAACDALREAGEAHFALEQIYRNAMDFPSLTRFTESFCESVLSRI